MIKYLCENAFQTFLPDKSTCSNKRTGCLLSLSELLKLIAPNQTAKIEVQPLIYEEGSSDDACRIFHHSNSSFQHSCLLYCMCSSLLLDRFLCALICNPVTSNEYIICTFQILNTFLFMPQFSPIWIMLFGEKWNILSAC